MPKNYTKEELENGRWVTVKGHRVFIKNGESPEEAFDRALGKKAETPYQKSLQKHPNAHRQNIHGYDVLHYYQGENPIYEVYNDAGRLLGIADSTSSLTDIIREAEEDEED